jgi:hypothetical protein
MLIETDFYKSADEVFPDGQGNYSVFAPLKPDYAIFTFHKVC